MGIPWRRHWKSCRPWRKWQSRTRRKAQMRSPRKKGILLSLVPGLSKENKNRGNLGSNPRYKNADVDAQPRQSQREGGWRLPVDNRDGL